MSSCWVEDGRGRASGLSFEGWEGANADMGTPHGVHRLGLGGNSGATHLLGGLGGVDALSIEEETHGTRLERLAGAESREDLRGRGRTRGERAKIRRE